MIFSKVKNILFSSLINLPGWRTNRKIIVIESDDWGSIRMDSAESYRDLMKAGYPVDECHYNRYDALESEDDLSGLFEVLSSTIDINDNHPVFTANFTVANPNFDKIRDSGYQQYFYEPFIETYEQYPNHGKSYQIVRQGIESGVMIPQSHGREHLNVHLWMSALQRNDFDTHMAFKHNMFSLHTIPKTWNKSEFMDAFRFRSLEEKAHLGFIASEAITVFKSIWDFCPMSFMAPSYFWYSDIESILHNSGVKFLQGAPIQLVPDLKSEKGFVKRYHYQGQSNKLGQRYLVRNVFFEPSENTNIDWVNECLKGISIAFRFKKPAIIQSHRVNYIGYIDPLNRSRNLRLLRVLLFEILRRWPDVEFMTSAQLGGIMETRVKQ